MKRLTALFSTAIDVPFTALRSTSLDLGTEVGIEPLAVVRGPTSILLRRVGVRIWQRPGRSMGNGESLYQCIKRAFWNANPVVIRFMIR